MKTPKEKAQEIVDRFNSIDGAEDCGNSFSYVAQQCALICVEEMIIQNGKYYLINGGETTNAFYKKENGYLFEVKQEIINL
jgi:hypothetical protein